MTMTDRKLLRGACLALVLASATVAPLQALAAEDSVAPAEEATFSEAETLLWLKDQLSAIDAPSVLTYSFVKDGSYEKGFEDRVVFTVSKIHADGMKAAAVEFFTGQRNFPVPPVDSTDVNPVLKIYFQGDVYEMNRLTDQDGKSHERWRYFQRRIKFALADGAQIEPVKVNFDGREYDAKRISFEPYKQDPKRAMFEKFADKRYTVTVADALPGYVYEIVTEVPDKQSTVPLLRDTLRLQSVAPYHATAQR